MRSLAVSAVTSSTCHGDVSGCDYICSAVAAAARPTRRTLNTIHGSQRSDLGVGYNMRRTVPARPLRYKHELIDDA